MSLEKRKENKNKKQDSQKIKIIPISGVEEVGLNCYVVEYEDHIIIIDSGLGFYDEDYLGVDYLIPNYDYLVKNKNKIEGIFITHGHLDHIGAIEHFLPKLGYPDVFAPEFAIELIKSRLDEAKILDRAKDKLHTVDNRSVLHNGKVTIEYFRVNHSIPDSYGVIVKTPAGNVVHSGDFKFDNSPLNEPPADYYKMSKTGEEGVKVLLSDSTNSFREGHSTSEFEIKQQLAQVIHNAKGRVIVATFSSLVTRLYALTEIAKEENRKIFITGRSMQQSFDIARKLNYIKVGDKQFATKKNVRRFSDQRLMVLATGSQGEHMAALSRMARGEHRDVKIKKGDTVILSSSAIPGNELTVQNLIDEISSLGATIVHQDIMDVHTSGHGFIEDQKLMINLFKPEFFMPIHGVQYFLNKHAKTAHSLGISENKTIITERGDIIEIHDDYWKKVGRAKHQPLLVSGNTVGDVGPVVLQDREKLAGNGMVVITALVKEEKGANGEIKRELYRKPAVFSRGFVYVKDNQELMEKIAKKVEFAFNRSKSDKSNFVAQFRTEAERHVSGMLYAKLERSPLIVTNIEVID